MDLTFFQINYLLLQFVGANLHRLFPLDFKLAPASSDLFPETHQYCIDFYCFPAPQGEEKKAKLSCMICTAGSDKQGFNVLLKDTPAKPTPGNTRALSHRSTIADTPEANYRGEREDEETMIL